MKLFTVLAERLLPTSRIWPRSQFSRFGKPRARRPIPPRVENLEARCLMTVFSSTNVPIDILDRATIISTITVPSTFNIADLNVTLDITHTFDADVEVALIGPDGTRVRLFQDIGGSADNFTSTTLDDEAATTINSSSAPYTGMFRPVDSLSVFDGKSAAGTWQLEVADDSSGNQGTLNSWSLDISPSSEEGLDRWYATVGDAITVTWSVLVDQPGSFVFELSGLSEWDLTQNATVLVDGTTSYNLVAPLLSFGQYESQTPIPFTSGLHTLQVSSLQAPTQAVVDDIIFALETPLVESTIKELKSLFIADHSTQAFAPIAVKLEAEGSSESFISAAALADYFAPTLHFTAGERFDRPYSVATSLAAGAAVRTVPLVTGSSEEFLDLAAFAPGGTNGGTAPTIYAAVLDGSVNGHPDEIAINYYFHYPRSDWGEQNGYNTHEGDWEGVVLFLKRQQDAQGQTSYMPDRMAFSIHVRRVGESGGEVVDWEQLNKCHETAHVYVGLGGHATYPGPGVTPHGFLGTFNYPEDHSGTGTKITGSSVNVELLPRVGTVATASENWLVFPGRWGNPDPAISNPIGAGHSGPRGPAFLDSGFDPGTRWLYPWTWSAGFDIVTHVPQDPSVNCDGVAVVEIIDRSGSMSGQALVDAKAAASLFVQLMNSGDEIGIASFSSSASADFGLVELGNDGTVQQQAINAINGLRASGSTAIGLGLRAGQGLLGTAHNDQQALILMSDGEENSGPGALSIIDAEIPAEVRVFTIGFGSGADATLLTEIARRRNGQYYSAPTGNDLAGIYDAIAAAVSGDIDIVSSTGQIQQDEIQQQSLTVDASVSQFRVSINYPGSDLDLALITPDGIVIDHAAMAGNPNVQLIEGATFEVVRVNQPSAGEWQIRIIGTDVTGLAEPFTLTARASADVRVELLPLPDPLLTGDTASLLADVVDGIPVVGATVVATLRPPAGAAIVVTLVDDGLHGDGAANDGRYGESVSFNQGVGVYAVSLAVTGTDNSGAAFVLDLNRTLTVTSNNTPPSISPVGDATTTTGASTTVTFQTDDVESGATGVIATAASSNPLLVGATGLVVQGTGADRTLIVTPEPGATGTADITVRVEDADGGVTTATFTLTVNQPHTSLDLPVEATSVRKGRKTILSPLAQVVIDNPPFTSLEGSTLVIESVPVGKQPRFGINQLGRGRDRLVQSRGQLVSGGLIFGIPTKGKAGNPFSVQFNSNATVEMVQTLLRQIYVQSRVIGPHTLNITLQLATNDPVTVEQILDVTVK